MNCACKTVFLVHQQQLRGKLMDVRIVGFCPCRILHRTGRRVQNWPSCAELTKRHENCKILQISYSNIALSLALSAATASAIISM